MENESGIQPIEYKVLVLPLEVDEKTKAGLYIPEDAHDMHQIAQFKGVLVAAGGNAFEDHLDPVPDIGETVVFSRHAGFRLQGADGKWYRIVNDKDVSGIVTDEIEDELTGIRQPLGKAEVAV